MKENLLVNGYRCAVNMMAGGLLVAGREPLDAFQPAALFGERIISEIGTALATELH